MRKDGGGSRSPDHGAPQGPRATREFPEMRDHWRVINLGAEQRIDLVETGREVGLVWPWRGEESSDSRCSVKANQQGSPTGWTGAVR